MIIIIFSTIKNFIFCNKIRYILIAQWVATISNSNAFTPFTSIFDLNFFYFKFISLVEYSLRNVKYNHN